MVTAGYSLYVDLSYEYASLVNGNTDYLKVSPKGSPRINKRADGSEYDDIVYYVTQSMRETL